DKGAEVVVGDDGEPADAGLSHSLGGGTAGFPGKDRDRLALNQIGGDDRVGIVGVTGVPALQEVGAGDDAEELPGLSNDGIALVSLRHRAEEIGGKEIFDGGGSGNGDG